MGLSQKLYNINELYEINKTSILCDFILSLFNSLKWLYYLGKPREYMHYINPSDKANIKSHNIDGLFYI